MNYKTSKYVGTVNFKLIFGNYDGGKDSAFNYSAILSAEIDELFVSFISYSKNHRIPNIQEIYFSTRDIFGPNLNLEPETAKTWQFCFNSFKENLTTDDDIFSFKAVYYNTHIDDYIHIF